MKKRYFKVTALFIGCLVLFILLNLFFEKHDFPMLAFGSMVLAILSTILYILFTFVNNRCPKCSKYIRYLMRSKHCPYCGEKLEGVSELCKEEKENH